MHVTLMHKFSRRVTPRMDDSYGCYSLSPQANKCLNLYEKVCLLHETMIFQTNIASNSLPHKVTIQSSLFSNTQYTCMYVYIIITVTSMNDFSKISFRPFKCINLAKTSEPNHKNNRNFYLIFEVRKKN